MNLRAVHTLIVAAVVLCSARFCMGADYSGKYVAKPGGGASASLDVIQTSNQVSITRRHGGKSHKSVCPLDGSAGEYMSSGGIAGKCKAQLKGKYLQIETEIATQVEKSPQPVRIVTIERWQLSADGKTLTIKSESSFPDFSSPTSAAVRDNTSRTERFTRVEDPAP